MDNQREGVSRRDNPLKWLLLHGAFAVEAMDQLIHYSENIGFGRATYSDGSPRDNVGVVFLKREDYKNDLLIRGIFDRVIKLSRDAGNMFNIDVWPDDLEMLQVARYLPGDHYTEHVDHSSNFSELPEDRKLTFYFSMSPNGALEVGGSSMSVYTGDAMVFPATMPHAAPQQNGGSRYSCVAWIPGPAWK